MTLRAFDVCAGVGGFHQGLAGIASVVLASEINRSARATYAANFPDTPLAGDVRGLVDVPPHDLLCAGFPCQPFSSMAEGSGRKGFGDPRGTLFFEIVRVLRAARPAGFILENVPGLVGHDGGRTFATIMAEVRDAGYYAHHVVVSAAPWVPQNRKRLFIMGVRQWDGVQPWSLAQTVLRVPPSSPRLSSILHEYVDPEHAPPPMSAALRATIEQRDADNVAAGRGFRSTIVGGDDVARTLTARYASPNRTNEILIALPGGGIRRLTPREAARLMGFPDTFILPDSPAQAFKQMGNAVVPAVVAAVARSLAPLLAAV